MNIKFIPIISPNDNSTTIVETLTLQEVFEKYGHVLSDKEKLDLIRVVQKSWPKQEEYLKRMTNEVDKLIVEMWEKELNKTTTIDIILLKTKDQYLGKAHQPIVLEVDTKDVMLTKNMLLKTEWIEMPLLRVVNIFTNIDNIKTITCVLNTGDSNAYIPTEYLDPNTQIQRDRIPLEVIDPKNLL